MNVFHVIYSKSWSSLPDAATLYASLPRSFKQECVVRTREEDPEVLKQRQELARAKTPIELSKITALSDFPVPATIESMMQPKRAKSSERSRYCCMIHLIDKLRCTVNYRYVFLHFLGRCSTPASEMSSKKGAVSESISRAMNAEVLVRVKDEDPEQQRQRQQLTRTKSPDELSKIRSLGDVPIPSPIKHLMQKGAEKEE
jgi:hypothetical protein